jgi:uncharacterized protein YdhG (YjbR/CyaY superfamily)
MNEVSKYINEFPAEVQERLNTIRGIIFEIAPQATERICWRMPTYELNGKKLVFFAGFKKHIGFYPKAECMEVFKEKLTGYKTSKGTVQLPLNEPLPLDILREMINYNVNESLKYSK